MSSITTAIPSGTIHEWCIKQLYADFDTTKPAQCANSSRGTTEADFETICCDGWIIDKSQDLWSYKPRNGSTYVDLANLVCCRVEGPQMGGLMPIVSNNGLTCTTGTPTPLASLAATNTKNAQIFPVTFTSASGVSPNIGDFLWTSTPYCLWADTAHGVAMMEATVSAASVSTLPVGWPNSDDPLIYPSTPTTSLDSNSGTATAAAITTSNTAEGITSQGPAPSSASSSTGQASSASLTVSARLLHLVALAPFLRLICL